ncbi:MAG: PSD1 and planctomycete cytochrome C domain-containing protein, partial [Pseudomonadota bacterium]
HGPGAQMGGLRLDSGPAVLAGGGDGKVITPGQSAGSLLIRRVSSSQKGFYMPPVGQRLTAEEIAVIRAWVDQGAKVPAARATQANVNAKSTHWSFQPIARSPVPDVRDRAWPRNPIDNFVLAKLEKLGVGPSPEADRQTLIRRLSLDLTGLPPAPDEVAQFVNDNRTNAYERLVDRLLDSPHYGEKWARFWLDLAHYADSDGYEKDLARPWAWRYRNWVIDAINADMPYDEFTIEQLAGDLLPRATTGEKVATGFLRCTLTNREAGVDRAEAHFDQLVNRTNTFGTAFLGLTVGCAQCHNHKYDPISQKEYYQYMAFFTPAEEVTIDAPLPGEMGPYLAAKPAYDKQRAGILAQAHIPELQAVWETKMRDTFSHPGKNLEWDFAMTSYRAMVDGADRLLKDDPATRSARDRDRLTAYFLGSPGPGIDKQTAAVIKDARKKIQALDSTMPRFTQAAVVRRDPDAPPAHIHIKGDPKDLGDVVEPGSLAVLPPLPSGVTPTRLTLARWVASRNNPLTARVAVNRMWQEFFGSGIVRTSEDFGTQGDPPTHPALLDWLASEFMDRGWSRKYLDKLIVMSATYRQSSAIRKDLESQDPDNTLLARQSRFRLPAELIRDEALEASGLLDTEIGGPSIHPFQPDGVSELSYGKRSNSWVESAGPERYRRGLYIFYKRTTPYPMLNNFDAPDSNTSCTRRRRSDTPLQALNLLNDPVFFEAAQALAVRVLREAPGPLDNRIDYAFELCLDRKPAPREKERLEKYYQTELGLVAKDDKSPDVLLPFTVEGAAASERPGWASAGFC